MIGYTNLSSTNKMFVKDVHGEILLQWNPALHGQFRLSRQKAHIFSLKLTRFIRTPDTRFTRTVSFVQTKSSYIFSKINPLYTDTG